MKNKFLSIVLLFLSLFSVVAFAQSKDKPVSLGLPGDDLDLYAALEVFQKSKTIEDFEKTLNDSKTGVNNLDLDKDKKVDFIKIITNKEDDDFSFILQVPVSKTENQDVAVIFVSKDKAGQVSIQAIGDEDMYGKDYVVEPKGASATGSGTANPGYSGGSSETMNLPAQTAPTTTVVVQSAPIVQYVYSPAYVPYYPPYYYGFYPPYYVPFVPIARAIFWANNFHCHGGYYGGYHGHVNVNVNHINHYNNYNNNSRNRSTTVANNKARGDYGNRGASGNNNNRGNNNRNSASTRPSTSDRSSSRASTRPSTSDNRASTRPTSPSTRESGSSRQSSSNNFSRPSNSSSNYSRPSSSSSNYSRPSSSSYGGRSGGGYSGGGRSGGGGGGMRGGGGRR